MRRWLWFQPELSQVLDDAFVKSVVFGFCPAAGLEADLARRSRSRSGNGVGGSDRTRGNVGNCMVLWRKNNGC